MTFNSNPILPLDTDFFLDYPFLILHFSDSEKSGSHYSQYIYLFARLTYLFNVTSLPNIPATSSACCLCALPPSLSLLQTLHMVVPPALTALLPQMLVTRHREGKGRFCYFFFNVSFQVNYE